MSLSDFAENAIQDVLFRGQSATINSKVLSWASTPTLYVGLIGGSATFPNNGYWLASTAYTVGQYCWPATANLRLYKCTSAGTTSSSAPTWPTTAGGTVTDGGVTWTEQTTALDAMTGSTMPEPTIGTYAYTRQTWTCSLAAVMGTALASSASASSGSTGIISNLSAIQFSAATGTWGPVWGIFIVDASTSGNQIFWYQLTLPKVVTSGDQLTFAAGTANTTYGALQIIAD